MMTRRSMLENGAMGLLGVALTSLLGGTAAATTKRSAPSTPTPQPAETPRPGEMLELYGTRYRVHSHDLDGICFQLPGQPDGDVEYVGFKHWSELDGNGQMTMLRKIAGRWVYA